MIGSAVLQFLTTFISNNSVDYALEMMHILPFLRVNKHYDLKRFYNNFLRKKFTRNGVNVFLSTRQRSLVNRPNGRLC